MTRQGVMVVIPVTATGQDRAHRGRAGGDIGAAGPGFQIRAEIVAKRQRRLTGVEDLVIPLSAKGLTHGEIAAQLAGVYGAEVSKQTITAITDRVMEGLAEWQGRPLDQAVYAVIFIDTI
jgi:transposase-like protein